MRIAVHKGFTLIEVSVATLLLVMTFGGLIALLILGQDSTITARNDLIAASLAEEGLNQLRFVRSENIEAAAPAFNNLYDAGSPAAPYYFLIDSARTVTPAAAGVETSAPLKLFNNLYGYAADPAATTTVFRRLITTNYHDDAGIYLDVVVQVYWKEGTRHNTVTVVSQLADWQ